jgi:hypothetical protein
MADHGELLRGLVAGADMLPARDIARQAIGLAHLKGSAADFGNLWAQAAAVGDPDLPLPAATAVSTSRIRQNLSAARFLGLSISGLLSAALLTEQEFDGHDQAAEARGQIIERFDSLAESAAELGEALEFERALALARGHALSLLAARFPAAGRRARREFLEFFPSVFLSYELFENLENEPALVVGNSARHPGFMPRSIEYLSHV